MDSRKTRNRKLRQEWLKIESPRNGGTYMAIGEKAIFYTKFLENFLFELGLSDNMMFHEEVCRFVIRMDKLGHIKLGDRF